MPKIRRLPRYAVAALALAVTVPGVAFAAAQTPDSPARAAAAAPAAAHAGVEGAMREALDALPKSDGRYTVAVADLDGGGAAVYGGGSGAYDTASIVKVDILAALLLHAQDRGEPLTAPQKKLAAAMIRHSDNGATEKLWKAVGETDGLNAANKRLGLKATQGDKDGHWGLTRTTAADQTLLLEAVLGDAHSPLTAQSRAYLRALMSTVEPDQRWGISAADDGKGPAAGPALKNGWLARSATGLWDVNSIGRVEHDGHTLLVAVLSDGQRTYKSGIDLVERAAETAVKAFVKAE
ncbi:serine hydrolase [Streptomyces sp. NBC_01716]|uniref:serine hydrolase n=1 Tax=Streptomyces sp. NBC_01716 TaxID=2975917 RepID=UPI002E35E48E|nr:serine hydrolase [Streptomyces sp. NBC_01716]